MIKQFIFNVVNAIGYEIRAKKQRPLIKRVQFNRLLYFQKIAQQIKNVSGTIVECGVGYGTSILFFSYLMPKREIWGLDSFEGFPEPTTEDTSPRNPKKGEWGGTTIEGTLNMLKSAEVDMQNIHLVKGFFERSITKYNGKPIALLHLDCDLYQSYKDCFPLYKHVQKGGVIAFDEYNEPRFPGATKAINEFLLGIDEELQYDKKANRYFIVKE